MVKHLIVALAAPRGMTGVTEAVEVHLTRKLAPRDTEIEELRNALRGIQKFLRAGDDGRPGRAAVPAPRGMAQTILEPGVEYAPFDPAPAPKKDRDMKPAKITPPKTKSKKGKK